MFEDLKKDLLESTNEIVICEVKEEDKKENILHIPKTSLLGTVIYNTEYIKVNNIIRIFGTKVEEIATRYAEYIPQDRLVIADDVIGGLFALKGRDILYFCPQDLAWDNLEIEFGQFINWIMSEKMITFYDPKVIEVIKDEVKDLDFNSCIQFYPFMFSEGFDVDTASKKVISSEEAIKLNLDMAKQLGNI